LRRCLAREITGKLAHNALRHGMRGGEYDHVSLQDGPESILQGVQRGGLSGRRLPKKSCVRFQALADK
jgi:ATP-dependent helicase YprA (DUF1998 family)